MCWYRIESTLPAFADVPRQDPGAVPHAIVAAALARDDPNSVVLPGIDVKLPDEASAEIDIVAICQGRILTGEVKTSN
jgi:hypothetical protein